MATSFNEQFDQHGAWRREFALRLKLLAEWLKDHDLLDAAVEERLRRLEGQMRSDKVMVAFVAEFSRGKSELINAIFFAGYKRRIMPASAGRTTMCPTELGYDAEVPPCLRLLAIETRLQPQPLMEWRMVPEKWTRIDLDVNDPAQLAQAFEKVSEIRRVSVDEARALGFWHDESPEDNPMKGSDGLVEVPKWRHALINIAHPLLKQGLVILDTPGLNAIGAEPELTVNLIPQAHAVVFILAADTGVTKSDLAIWREHLIAEDADADSRLVVLNKIDTMWDSLNTPTQVQAQIDRQVATTAEILGLTRDQVIPVSGQKGLIAKVNNDAELLAASRLPVLEQALADGVMGQRQKILRSAVGTNIVELRTEATRVLGIRRRDLAEQMVELKGLRGKNTSVIKHMRARIEQEQADFDASGAKIHAVRSVHLKLLREVFNLLGTTTLKTEMAELTDALRQPGIKLGVRKAYGLTFDRLREGLKKAERTSTEIQSMLTGTFRQLNAEYGFSLQAPREPDLNRYERDLDLVQRSHNQYLGVSNALRLAQPEFADRLVRALATRLRVIYESALGEVELWNKSAAAQLDAQLRERRRNFGRRLEAIERIQQAATGLDDRIGEIESQENALDLLDAKLTELTSHLTNTGLAKLPAAMSPPVRPRGEYRKAQPEGCASLGLPAGFAGRVIDWQRTHGRNTLPWQNTRDPYRVWLSEVMLQQTQVAAVLGYYQRFLQRFPDVQALAQAPLDDVLGLWSGLGYYSRARNLHRCAQDVVQLHGGEFPRTAQELQTLPGVGPSTAAAIASFCFGERVAIFDGNVKRVLSRVLAFGDDLSIGANERALWDHARGLLPALELHESMPRYTQGLMDIGATVCAPRNPACLLCPVQEQCGAARAGRPEDYPRKTRKVKRTAESLWLLHAQGGDGKVWLQKRPAPGVWGGLYCLPVFGSRDALEQALPLRARRGLRDADPFVHVLTHKDLHLHPVEAVLPADWGGAQGAWFGPGEWPGLGLPAPVRRLLEK